ncbi:MAG: type VI secretion system protein IglI family protein [Chlamydiales bacterium]
MTQGNPAKSASEAVVEEYFDSIVQCMEQEKSTEAVEMIEKVLIAGVADIRLIGYFLYIHFANHGIKSFTETLPLLTSLFNDHWSLLRPLNKTEKHVQNSLNWYFSEVLFKLRHIEKLQKGGHPHPLWKKSLEMGKVELDHLTTILHAFKQFFLEKWPQTSTKDKLLHLVKKIDELIPLIEERLKLDNKEKAPPQEEPATSLTEDSSFEEIAQHAQMQEESFDNDSSQEDFSWYRNQEDPPIFNEAQDTVQHEHHFEIPPHIPEENDYLEKLENFLQKLKVFETFISQNDYLKAAVVARDIDHLIDTFDPLNYFPKLFAKYFALFAKHVAALSDQYEKRDSLQVKALEKLYRADIEMFIHW